MQIQLSRCRTILTVTWMVGAGIIILVKILFTGTFGQSDHEAWNWLIPNIFPTLSLTTSVSMLDAFNANTETRLVNKSALTISLALSVAYLVIVFGTLAAVIFTTGSPVEILRSSNVIIGALQAIVIAALATIYQKATSGTTGPEGS